jgi:hypothetical protein
MKILELPQPGGPRRRRNNSPDASLFAPYEVAVGSARHSIGGWVTKMKTPTQCALWENPRLIGRSPEQFFKRIDTYVDESHLMRSLLSCRECGQLYFYEFYEEIDWKDGDDPQYQTYIPVETDVEIEALKNASTVELLQFSPRLQRDFPKGAEQPDTRWIGKPDNAQADQNPFQERLRKIEASPRFVKAKPSGQGFIVPGARYTATVAPEPTVMHIDPDRPSVPTPVPMGPYRKGTEQLIGDCVATHPGLTREEAIKAL